MRSRAEPSKSASTGVCPVCGRRGKGVCPDCGRRFAPVRRAALAGGAPVSPSALGRVPAALAGGGRPLDARTAGILGERFDRDVGDVRVHTDSRAAASARDLRARAYAVGNDVVFGQGEFRPGTPAGLRLIGHEVAHVLQQRGARPDLRRLTLDHSTTSASEREADAAGTAVARGRPTPALTAAPAASLARTVQSEEDESDAGCGVCMSAKLAGIYAHKIAQKELRGDLPGVQPEVIIRLGSDDKTPPGTSGRLDLIVFVGDEVHIGEIKPDGTEQVQHAKDQLKIYMRLIDESEHRELKGRIVRLLDLDITGEHLVGGFKDWFAPNCVQMLYIRKIQPGVYTYFCEPHKSTMRDLPGCKCRPRKEKEKEKKKQKKKGKGKGKQDPPIVAEPLERDDRQQPPELPVPVPVRPDVPVSPEEEKEEPSTEEEPVAPEETPDTEEEPSQVPGDGVLDGEEEPSRGPEEEGEEDEEPFWIPPQPRPDVGVGIALARLALELREALIAKAREAASAAAAKVLLYARLAALLPVLLSGRAALGAPGQGEDPLVMLYRVMTESGNPPSPELKKLIESDEGLRNALREAARTGDVTRAQEELSKRTMQVIEDNIDQFSAKDIRKLLVATDGALLPGADVTADKLRRALDAKEAGQGQGSGEGTGTGEAKRTGPPPEKKAPGTPSGPGRAEGQEPGAGEGAPEISLLMKTRLADAGEPATRLWQGLTGTEKGALKADEQLLDEFLKRVSISPRLTDAEVDRLLREHEWPKDDNRAQFAQRLETAIAAVQEQRKTGEGGREQTPPPATGATGKQSKAPKKRLLQPPESATDPESSDPQTGPPRTPVGERLTRDFTGLAAGQWFVVKPPELRWEELPKNVSTFFALRTEAGVLVGGYGRMDIEARDSSGRYRIKVASMEWFDTDDRSVGVTEEFIDSVVAQ